MIVALDQRPLLIAIAGPNGAGKSTFFASHVSYTNLPFINADIIAAEAQLGAYEAAEVAEAFRKERFGRQESFVFETVYSDPVADKLSFLKEAVAAGYNVVLFFIGLASADTSLDRVAQRVLQGGHSVPKDKIYGRYDRTMENLRLSLLRLPTVMVYDNEDLRDPHRFVLAAGNGRILEQAEPLPEWLKPLLPKLS